MPLFENYNIVRQKKKFIPDHKVYFSLSSEGLGHSSRGLAIAKEFSKEEVVIGTYDYALERFEKAGYNCVELPLELKLVGTKGAFDVKKTILKNHAWALKFNDLVNQEIDAIRENGASCVVADGRLAPVMAADRLGLPCVVITNQSAFYPFFEKDSALVRVFGKSFDWVMRTWLSSAEEIMIPDFPPPDTVCLDSLCKNFKVMKRTRFVGPLVNFDIENLESIEKPAEKYIAVVLGGHAYRKPLFDTVIELAKTLPDYHFDIFSSFDADEISANVRIFRSVSNIGSYLSAADLVITQAGHSTAMELLSLGKPSIVVPDFMQIEQENNASRMELIQTSIKLEYKDLTQDKLASVIFRIMTEPVYAENARRFRNIAREIQGSKRAASVIRDYSARLQCY